MTITATATQTFIKGQTYSCNSPCDSNCIWKFTVEKRTAKTVWLKDEEGNVKSRRVCNWNDQEMVSPLGSYSMCPVLRAE